MKSSPNNQREEGVKLFEGVLGFILKFFPLLFHGF